MASTAKKTTQPSGEFEYIEPPRKLSDVVSYFEAGQDTIHPIKVAERQLGNLSFEFDDWLKADCEILTRAWLALKASPTDAESFVQFHRAIHTVYGNSPLLERESVSRLTKPLTRLLERSPDIREHIRLIDSALIAVATIARQSENPEGETFDEICTSLELIVDGWIDRKS